MSSSTSDILVIGLSGPSSSGKTTLARLLRGIFNNEKSLRGGHVFTSLFILHEDDFYKSDAEIPIREVSSTEHGTRKLQDWDCVESLNLPLLERTLQHVSQHGTLPSDMVSKEDQNSVGKTPVSDDEIRRHEQRINDWLSSLTREEFATSSSSVKGDGNDRREIRICILDGFLLYPAPPSHRSISTDQDDEGDSETTPVSPLNRLYSIIDRVLDRKLFVPCTYRQTVQRRAARTGYVTMEGFWTDPPGYVEDIVWPNYARDHAWMFKDAEDIDGGVVDRKVAEEQNNILVGPGSGDAELSQVLDWGVLALREIVAKKLVGSRSVEEET